MTDPFTLIDQATETARMANEVAADLLAQRDALAARNAVLEGALEAAADALADATDALVDFENILSREPYYANKADVAAADARAVLKEPAP